MDDVYAGKPWLTRYDEHTSPVVDIEHRSALAMFRASLAQDSEAPAVRYFDRTLTFGELDELSDALAVSLASDGIGFGDRVAFVLQNVPQFLISTVAVWKLGAVVVPINPMYRDRELSTVLTDSGAVAVICLESVAGAVGRASVGTDVRRVITTSELDFQTRVDERIFGYSVRSRHDGFPDFLELIEATRGRSPAPCDPGPEDLAYLPYTSGTTGPPKGSMNTHSNVVFAAQIYRDWLGLRRGGAMFAVAPLFHITGLIGHLAAPLLAGVPTILTCRFHPIVAAEAISEHQATAIIGAITVFIAWTDSAAVPKKLLDPLKSVYSGGAPIPHAALEAFRAKFGHYIHNGYGLTETNSPAIVVPNSCQAPVDPSSGAVAIGVPVSNTHAQVVDENDNPLPVGEYGEIVISGPQVAVGYWNKPAETAHAMPGGRFHTGDIGFMDADGWFFIVDRMKDQINASGFKVWPREVEDVLYEHPAVREAAVVGVMDSYRGETVKAFVSFKDGAVATTDEMIEFCKERLAAYKYPRVVEVMDDLPKTVSGKILRRELRVAP
ncbi:long-chain acyl-CoA synthetase [Rhodococcus sp. 27YEA15]